MDATLKRNLPHNVDAERSVLGAILIEGTSWDCPADLNADGAVNSQDFILFLNLFIAQDPAADFNGDGQINSQDFIAFLNAFVAGC